MLPQFEYNLHMSLLLYIGPYIGATFRCMWWHWYCICI